MESLGDILGGIASAAGGGIFGIIGSVVTGIFRMKEKAADRQFEKDKWAQENRLFELEMERDHQRGEQEIAIAAQKGSWGALGESMLAEAELNKRLGGVTANIKALFRPILTVLLWGLSAFVVWSLIQALTEADGDSVLRAIMSEQEIAELLKYSIYTTLFSAATAATWWFADRALLPPSAKRG